MLGQNAPYVIGLRIALLPPIRVERGGCEVDSMEEIVSRAIDYTNIILRRMPSYRDAAVSGLRTLRASLAAKNPDNPALGNLDAYLETLRNPRSDESL
jgi:hypothetical protein